MKFMKNVQGIELKTSTNEEDTLTHPACQSLRSSNYIHDVPKTDGRNYYLRVSETYNA